MRRIAIIFRHGERAITLAGDGPLTRIGKMTVSVHARKIAEELKEWGTCVIDRALVSGSIRCAETFSMFWYELISQGIQIGTVDMRPEFYGTPEENKAWKKVYKPECLSDIEKIGERAALMKHAGHLIEPCVQRYLNVIRGTQSHLFIVVTHGPHDALIAEALTGEPQEGLKMGEGRIIHFES